MIKHFENLTEEELNVLKDSVAWVTVLIAGADGHKDEKEKEWALKLSKIRTYSGSKVLRAFYEEVNKDLKDKLEIMWLELPDDIHERSKILAEKIAGINPILAKLDQYVGASFYTNLKSFGEHVAKASGGFLRMWSISAEEKKWLHLDMVKPIEFPETDEEE